MRSLPKTRNAKYVVPVPDRWENMSIMTPFLSWLPPTAFAETPQQSHSSRHSELSVRGWRGFLRSAAPETKQCRKNPTSCVQP